MKEDARLEEQDAGRLDTVRWIALPSHTDERGTLTAVENGIDIPFAVNRLYFLHHLSGERGGHAHRDTQQVVIPVSGSGEIELTNGCDRRRFVLDDPERGLYFGPMLYLLMHSFSANAVVLVLASTHYDKTRSIRSWKEYLQVIGCQ